MSSVKLIAYFVIFFLFGSTEASVVFVKCCPEGFAFDNEFKCIISREYDTTILNAFGIENITGFERSCFRSGESADDVYVDEWKLRRNDTILEKCIDVNQHNGSIYVRQCPANWRERIARCDSIFTSMKFWGANMVAFASLIYIFPYLFVVIVYIVLPELRHRAYDRAVFCYNMCQLFTAVILLGIGFCVLCHTPIQPTWIYIILGLSLQFLTISSVFWLNMVCFDMTLVITRFRWIPGSDVSGKEENRKYYTYSAWSWGVSGVVTTITCIVELLPYIPKTSVIKPNFERFDDGTNFTVVAWVMVIPMLTLIMNNALFIYTTYKVIKIGKSTAMVTNSNNKKVRKKYFMFMRLYLLMDAPWIIGFLAAIYPELWVLKFLRMIQPILMFFAIIPRKTLVKATGWICTPLKKCRQECGEEK